MLVARRGLHRGDDLARDAQLREVPEARLTVGAVVANRFVEPYEALLDEVVGVAADQEVRGGLEPDEPVVAAHDLVVGVLLALLGERDEVVIIKLYFRVRLRPGIATRGRRPGGCGSGHRRLLSGSIALESSVARYLPWRQVVLKSLHLKLDFSLIWAAVCGVMEPCQARVRASARSLYTRAAAAVDTLSEPTRPRTGRRHELVAERAHARAQATSLGAQDEHHAARVVGPVVGDGALGVGAVDPGAGAPSRRRASRPGCAPGPPPGAPLRRPRPCRRPGSRTPSGAPGPPRRRSPRSRPHGTPRPGCAGPVPRRGRARARRRQRAASRRRRRGIPPRPRRCPGARASRRVLDLAPGLTRRTSTPSSQASAAAPSVAQTRAHPARAARASRTGLRP